jgi:thymidylate synthase (FAD)
LPEGAQLCKVAGQVCYMSFGPKRTKNEQARRYFDNLKSSGHGSVFEHANFSLLLYGISRSVTHELIRHRAGFGFSQLSQRYVSGRMLRFVERPEYQTDEALHAQFLKRIDGVAAEYAALTDRLLAMQQEGASILSAEARTDLRKKVQQCARSVLPNETEAPIVTTANARAWRHFIEMRASAHAEIEIRELALRAFLCLRQADPILFDDYTLVALPDGTYAVKTEFEKV